MDATLSSDDIQLIDEISELGAALWASSQEFSGMTTDPAMFSVMLFRRLWSNHRGFILLWNNNLQTEADIVLRSGVEAAICIAATAAIGEEFITRARYDTIETLKRQIRMWREDGGTEMVQEGEATLRDMLRHVPEGVKPKAFDWKELASLGGVPQLYNHHRALSGLSSHVTGMSLLRGVVGADNEWADQQAELATLTKVFHLRMMAGTTLLGCAKHAGMIGAADLGSTAEKLVDRLNVASGLWTE